MKTRANEYWEVLPEFASIRRSERAKAVLAAVKDPENVQWRPLQELLLSDSQIDAARRGTNRAQRKSLEERWSFSGIANYFAASELPGLRLFGNMAHGYGNSSHSIHKDGDGVALAWERRRRDPTRQTAVTLNKPSAAA